MEELKTFRHEQKYVIPYNEMLSLRKKFNDLLKIDRSPNGYMVRSLYFDSVNDEDYYDKLGGEANRKKIRLRIYDTKKDYVKLEIKAKHDVHQLKESIVIDKKTANELIKGNYRVLLDMNSDTALKIYTIMSKGYYRPKVIIEYDRIAYLTNTTTRITFDFNIKRSYDFNNFFSNKINYLGVTDGKDIILEVKFDRFLEPYITTILNGKVARYQSVSKYIMCRNI